MSGVKHIVNSPQLIKFQLLSTHHRLIKGDQLWVTRDDVLNDTCLKLTQRPSPPSFANFSICNFLSSLAIYFLVFTSDSKSKMADTKVHKIPTMCFLFFNQFFMMFMFLIKFFLCSRKIYFQDKWVRMGSETSKKF